MLSPEDAWARIEAHLAPPTAETVPVDGARGRVLAAEVVATLDVPPCDVSAMDGFAIAGAVAAGDELAIAGMVAAGDAPGATLPAAAAMRIMTGAPLPRGADRVVPVELTATVGDIPDRAKVRFLEPDEGAGRHVRRRGEVAARGHTILGPGHLVTPGTASQLASHGIERVTVARAPHVAFVTTGSEIVDPATEPRPGQIRDSHTAFFRAACAQLGLDARPLGIAPDRLDPLREKVDEGLRADVLLLSGGVSMGELDLVEDVLAEHGCTLLFDAVAIQPGKPVVAARHPGGWVFALPGNPASAMVTFWLFVRPALRRMLGLMDGFWHGALTARLEAPLAAAKGRDLFLPARVRFADGEVVASPVPPLGSHDVAAYSHGTALVRARAGSPAREAGESCEILPLVEWPVPARPG
ncbi:MAG TPA: gephyrin-like molybdotransferase Glp [Thermoanaerobaculia bacterium]|nr:gephyrin-like molybdotransferase Glp [Thermoanaerobaculia bacterium]